MTQKLDDLQSKGWAGPFPLLDANQCCSLSRLHDNWKANFTPSSQMQGLLAGNLNERPWFKSMHAYIPEFFDLVRNPMIVERVKQHLGENLIAWGCTVTVRQPGQIHRWHVDIEHLFWEGISVFIGLENTSQLTTLSMISGSHRAKLRPTDIADSLIDGSVERFAQDVFEPFVTPCMGNGDFLIFSNTLWHSSSNLSKVTRKAILIQYCATDSPARMLMNWSPPFKFHPEKPPCVSISGSLLSCNNFVISRPLMLATRHAVNEHA